MGFLFGDFCMDLAFCPSVSELSFAFWWVLSCVKSIFLDPEARILLTLAVGALLWVWSLFCDLEADMFGGALLCGVDLS